METHRTTSFRVYIFQVAIVASHTRTSTHNTHTHTYTHTHTHTQHTTHTHTHTQFILLHTWHTSDDGKPKSKDNTHIRLVRQTQRATREHSPVSLLSLHCTRTKITHFTSGCYLEHIRLTQTHTAGEPSDLWPYRQHCTLIFCSSTTRQRLNLFPRLPVQTQQKNHGVCLFKCSRNGE